MADQWDERSTSSAMNEGADAEKQAGKQAYNAASNAGRGAKNIGERAMNRARNSKDKKNKDNGSDGNNSGSSPDSPGENNAGSEANGSGPDNKKKNGAGKNGKKPGGRKQPRPGSNRSQKNSNNNKQRSRKSGPRRMLFRGRGRAKSKPKNPKWSAQKIAAFIVVASVLFTAVFLIFFVTNLPSVVWNSMFHVDSDIDPIKDEDIEMNLKDTDIEAKEEEWAELISSHLSDSHDAVYDRIKEQCAKDGVDYDATQSTIVDSTDFLGTDQAKDMDFKYNSEQTVYNRLKKKGYSQSAALSAIAAMSYLTNSDLSYNVDKSNINNTTKIEDATTEVGAFKFNRVKFENYILKAYPETKDDPVKLKDKITDGNVQANYLDKVIKEKLSKNDYKSFKKENDDNKAVKAFCKALGLSNAESKISAIIPGMRQKHLINVSTGGSGSGKKSGVTGQQIVDYALKFADKKPMYRYKLDGPNSYELSTKPGHGIQCAGFVSVVYDHFGLNTWGEEKGVKSLWKKISAKYTKVSADAMKPGDVVFFCDNGQKEPSGLEHVAIYVGSGKMVSASTPSTGITQRKTSYHTNGRHISSVYRIVSGSDGSGSESNPAADRAKAKLSEIQARSGYPADKIKAYKKSAEQAYNKNKSGIDSAYKALLDSGLSPAAAAGILGNAWQESGWDTDVISGDGRGSQGIIQWTDSRKTTMKSWIKGQGGDWKDITWQARFAAYEIKSGSESSSFKTYAGNVTSYGSGFWVVSPVNSFSGFASSDDPLQTTVNYCGCIERCQISAANMTNRYAGTEVILEKCGGIAGNGSSGDPSNTGAGSRQMALILSAFSVKEDQLFPMEKEVEAQEKDLETADSITNFISKLGGKIAGDSGAKKGYSIGEKLGKKYLEIKNFQRHPDPKKDLEDALQDNQAQLFDVEYGDIVENDDGKKVYASVEIRPATTDEIIKNVFKLDPSSTYQTEDGILLGDKDTTVDDAVTTLADNHMEMLYGNHEYGGSVGGSAGYGNYGEGSLGLPMPPANCALNTVSSWYGKRTPPTIYSSNFHDGVDFSTAVGTPLYAAADGKISRASVYGGYGNCIDIDIGGGTIVRYGHLSQILVSNGATVKRGQQIGLSGNTGNSTGPHLHFEVRVNGKTVDPIPMIYPGQKSKKNI